MEDGPVVRVLTVGDGDLSYSLALARAFSHTGRLALTATTFLTSDELLQTYTHAATNIAELTALGATVRGSIDATNLEAASPALGAQDHILFNHPHLGLIDLLDTKLHAQRHRILLAHYLSSAAALAAPNGHVHLLLCGNQPRAWSITEHATRLGLPTPAVHDVAAPPPLGLDAIPPEDGWAARRRFRSGEVCFTGPPTPASHTVCLSMTSMVVFRVGSSGASTG